MTDVHTEPHRNAEIGAVTREKLLDAAERLFAYSGFAATSVRDITTAAGCNVAAVNYHFGGKDSLYRDVFVRRLAALRQRRLASIESARSRRPSKRRLEEALRLFAAAFLEPLFAENDGGLVMELIAREMLDPHLPPELFHAEIVEPVRRALGDAIMEIAPGIRRQHAQLCVISIVAQLVNVVQQRRRAKLGASQPAALPPLEEWVRHIARFSAAGIWALARREE